MDAVMISVFGAGTALSALQMGCRAGVLFFVTLALIRLSGRRSFGQHTSFDACVTVLLGAVMSRAVVGASPLGPTIRACITLVALHRGVAMLAGLSPAVVNGSHRVLGNRGRLDRTQMRKALIAEPEVVAALRLRAHTEAMDDEFKIVLGRNGNISVVRSTALWHRHAAVRSLPERDRRFRTPQHDPILLLAYLPAQTRENHHGERHERIDQTRNTADDRHAWQ